MWGSAFPVSLLPKQALLMHVWNCWYSKLLPSHHTCTMPSRNAEIFIADLLPSSSIFLAISERIWKRKKANVGPTLPIFLWLGPTFTFWLFFLLYKMSINLCRELVISSKSIINCLYPEEKKMSKIIWI